MGDREELPGPGVAWNGGQLWGESFSGLCVSVGGIWVLREGTGDWVTGVSWYCFQRCGAGGDHEYLAVDHAKSRGGGQLGISFLFSLGGVARAFCIQVPSR